MSGLLKWFQSYLSNHTQRAVLSSYSSSLRVKSGVPQGFILSPLFFIIYILTHWLISNFSPRHPSSCECRDFLVVLVVMKCSLVDNWNIRNLSRLEEDSSIKSKRRQVSCVPVVYKRTFISSIILYADEILIYRCISSSSDSARSP